MARHAATLADRAPGRRVPRFALVDISNSRTKTAWSTPRGLGRRSWIPTAELSVERLADAFGRGEAAGRADLAVVSSVVPEKTAVVRELFGDRLVEVSHRIALGIEVDYPRPGTIGADRLANAVALNALYGAPGVVVDFGTAVTFDVLSPERAYVGGVIAPGLEVMTDYMYQRTALLPRISLREPRDIVGRSTREAMLAGAVHGYRGLVREILGEIRREIAGTSGRRKIHVVATGGYAGLIAAALPEIGEVRPHLTLEGLRIIALLNGGAPDAAR